MQQTKTYKLNKPGKDDTFSPDPLNENADKLETALNDLSAADKTLNGAVAAAEARRCIDKLLGPIVITEGKAAKTEAVIDLSGIDLKTYRVLFMTYTVKNSSEVYAYTQDDYILGMVHCGTTCGGGFTVFLMGEDNISTLSMSAGISGLNHIGSVRQQCVLVSPDTLTALHLKYCGPGSWFTLYGLRS